MKTILIRTSLAGILAASAVYAQATQAAPRYTVIDLGTLGGTFSIAFGINNAGRVGGSAAVHNGETHPFLSGWLKTDLGTLGGKNAQASGPNGRENVSILSETSTLDPLKEDFCGFGNHLQCLGALWDGVKMVLPTLGGNNAMALGLNDRNQVIGVAENGKHDPACTSPQVLDFEAVVWGPGQGQVQELPPLRGDTAGFALGLNNSGQIVGATGTCANVIVTAVGLFLGTHAVLWDNGPATDLGSLGGTLGKAAAINERGEVAGLSSLPGDSSIHSFLWSKDTGMQDLGALGADVVGDPAGINNNTQIVGGSCDKSGNCRAFFWDKKVLSDLNDFLPADSPLYLLYALGINDAGEIVGFALEKKTGEVHGYLASPVRGKSGQQNAVPAVQAGPGESRQVNIPENVRAMLRRRLPIGRLGARQVNR
jgi:probable HAF family extracellular repeat protein